MAGCSEKFDRQRRSARTRMMIQRLAALRKVDSEVVREEFAVCDTQWTGFRLSLVGKSGPEGERIAALPTRTIGRIVYRYIFRIRTRAG